MRELELKEKAKQSETNKKLSGKQLFDSNASIFDVELDDGTVFFLLPFLFLVPLLFCLFLFLFFFKYWFH